MLQFPDNFLQILCIYIGIAISGMHAMEVVNRYGTLNCQ